MTQQEDESSLNNIHSLIISIPHMSNTIVDDTLYEKVLTILTTFLDNMKNCVYFDEWNVLNILLQVINNILLKIIILAIIIKRYLNLIHICK